MKEQRKEKKEEKGKKTTWLRAATKAARSFPVLLFSLFILQFSFVSCSSSGEGGGNTYKVTVNGGTGSGNYKQGVTVTITATVPHDQHFINWTVNSGGVTLANSNSLTTTFTMPGNNVTVTANINQSGSKGLTVNNLPNGDWGAYVFSSGTDVSTYQKIIDAWTSSNWQAVGGITTASGGGNVFTLFSWDGQTQTSEWNGSGGLPVVLLKMNGTNMAGSLFDTTDPTYRYTTVGFNNGSGTTNFSNFLPIVMESLTVNGLPDGTYILYIYDQNTDLSTYSKVNAAFLSMEHKAIGTTMSALGGRSNEFALFNWTGTAQSGSFTENGAYKALLYGGNELNMVYRVADVNFINGIGSINYSDFIQTRHPVIVSFNGVSADGANGTTTSKLILTFSEDVPGLIADDIVIAADFGIVKGDLIKTGTGTYDLAITPGGNGEISVGLDEEVFLGWTEKTTDVYAVFHFNSTPSTITGYGLTGGTVNIPSEIAGIPVTSIGSNAFSNKQLTGVTIPNSISSIGSYAFMDNQLTSVVIPDSITIIEVGVFANNKLSHVTIPNSVTSFQVNQFDESSAFANNLLENIIIPNGVTKIPNGIFANNKLTSVTIPNTVIVIGSISMIEGGGPFENNQLTSINIPNNVTTIGINAFANNELENVTIGNNVTEIFARAFLDNKLTSVTIPNGVTHIGQRVFTGNQITHIDIPDSVTSIDNGVFRECYSLISVTIGKGLAEISDNAFRDCNNLINITIPDSIERIGDYAFYGCTNLTNVTFERANLETNFDSFEGDLQTKYLAGGIGTYTRDPGGEVWTKLP